MRSGRFPIASNRENYPKKTTVVKRPPEAPKAVPLPYETPVHHDGHASTDDAYRVAARDEGGDEQRWP